MKARFPSLLGLTLIASALLGQQKKSELQVYLERMFPQCPGRNVSIEQLQVSGPHGFVPYRVRLTSSEQGCGRETFMLLSPATRQVVVGDLFPLAPDMRRVEVKVREVVERLLKKPVRVSIGGNTVEDGLREVTISRDGKEGPFDIHGFLDSSQGYLIVGRRGRLDADPRQELLSALSANSPVRRGKPDAKIHVLELSDFQCPSCKHAHEMLEGVIEKNLGRISYSRIDLPLVESHDWSVSAAVAARAIQRISPEHYWPFVDYLFDNQSAIKRETIDMFVQDFVEASDIDTRKFNSIYKSPSERQAVVDQVERLFDLGIFATPTYIVNGQEIYYGREGSHIKQYLETLLKSEERGGRSEKR